ncbi:MAG: pyridoxal phosphate-dependent aminotransferase [Phycisphaerales bacterium]|nr:pyridoxal phosphate-dependent aminotransferase [Phycisphaerales bacterium]
MNISQRASSIPPSSTLAITAKVREMKARGEDVIGFGAGEPDFTTPSLICDAAIDALHDGQTHYAPTPGTPAAREAVANKLREENGIDCTAGHITINNGAKFTVYLALQALVDPGDEVILPTPAWVSYKPMIELAGGTMVEVAADAAADFKITPEQLEAAITPRTRAMLLNSPSNPCGTMYTPDEIRALVAVLERHEQVTVISDEIYEQLVYGDDPALSVGSIESMRNRTVTINGLSKTFAMTGWRIGYACAPGDGGAVIKAMNTMQSQMTSSITSFTMPAVVAALGDGRAEVDGMRRIFAGRAELIHGLVRQWEGVRCPRPTGAFYIFPDISFTFGRTSPGGVHLETALDFASAILEEAGVAVVPGNDFLGPGRRHVRMSFATSEEEIAEGCGRVREWLGKLTGTPVAAAEAH